MKALALSISNLTENNYEFDFSNQNAVYDKNALKVLKNAINDVIYGNDSLTVGIITFDFEIDNDNYKLERSFAEKNVLLTLPNNSLLENDEADKFLQSIILPKDEFNAVCSDNFTFNNIGNTICQTKKNDDAQVLERLQKEIAADVVDDDIEKVIDSLQEELVENKAKLSVISDLKTAVARLETLEEEYKSDLEKGQSIDILKERINLSRKNKDILATIDNSRQNEKEIEELTKKLDIIKAELETGEKAIEQIKNHYLFFSEKGKELNLRLKDYILHDIDENDGEFTERVNSYYADFDEQAEILKKEKEEKTLAYNELLDQIASLQNELSEVRLGYNVKRDIRNSLMLATVIDSKKEKVRTLSSIIDSFQKRLEVLYSKVKDNNSILNECAKKDIEFENEGEEALYAKLNNAEMLKQTLYRNQILIGTLQLEISAIDNKIYENESAKREYNEDKNALTAAKKTLNGFMEKLATKIESLEQKLVETKVKKKYYDELVNLEYGENCPVCNSKLMDKKDYSKAQAKIENAYNDLQNEKNKALSVQKDYVEQLEKVNLRLGELSTREKDSDGYIESLKNTKNAKIEMIKNLLKSVEASDNNELSHKLSESIKLSAYYAEKVANYKNLKYIKDLATSNINAASTEIDLIEKDLLPNAKDNLNQTEKDLISLASQFESLKERIGIDDLSAQAENIDKKEAEEDGIYSRLSALTLEKQALDTNISDLDHDISLLQNRIGYTVEKNGKDYTYPALIMALISDRFNEYNHVIEKNESERQAASDKLVATSRVLENKKKEYDRIYNEVEERLKNSPQISENPDNSQIIPDEKISEMEEDIKKIQEKIKSTEYEIGITESFIRQHTDLLKEEDELKEKTEKVITEIALKRKEVSALYAAQFIGQTVSEMQDGAIALRHHIAEAVNKELSDFFEINNVTLTDKGIITGNTPDRDSIAILITIIAKILIIEYYNKNGVNIPDIVILNDEVVTEFTEKLDNFAAKHNTKIMR